MTSWQRVQREALEEMIEASKMLVQASTTGGPPSTCGPKGRIGRTRPPLLGSSSCCSTCTKPEVKPGLQQREATLDSGRAKHIRPAFAAFDTRIDHKLIAAASCGPATRQQQIIYKAISKSAAECSEATPGAVRTRRQKGLHSQR